MAKKVGTSARAPHGTCNDHNISVFSELCIKDVEAGRRLGPHFNKERSANLIENFRKETGNSYSKAQLKNK